MLIKAEFADRARAIGITVAPATMVSDIAENATDIGGAEYTSLDLYEVQARTKSQSRRVRAFGSLLKAWG